MRRLLAVLALLSGFATTIALPSNAVAAEPIASPVGYLGGSLTVNAVDGYRLVGGTRFWTGNDNAYGGGTVTAWANGIGNPSDTRWLAFRQLHTGNGSTPTLWIQLLAHQSLPQNPDAARRVVQHAKSLVPEASAVYVSAMNGYTDYSVITCTTAAAVNQMRTIVDQLVAQGLALRGPVVGRLDPATETRDGCHANEAGQRKLGNRLLAFFG